MIAATGWRLEDLELYDDPELGAAGLAALAAAPTFALRRLALSGCGLDAASFLGVASAPWPLEELDLSRNDLSAAAAAPALAALSRRAGLRRLSVDECELSAAGFKALVEAAWPALTSCWVCWNTADVRALGAAAFARFPALEELGLSRGLLLGEAGARLLASRRWPRLRKLYLRGAQIGDAGVAALARGEWPALEVLDLSRNCLGAPLTLEDARRWAPDILLHSIYLWLVTYR